MIGTRRRGQPLAVLAILLGGWIAARVVLWQSPFPLGAALAADVARVAVAGPSVDRTGAQGLLAPRALRVSPLSLGGSSQPWVLRAGVAEPPRASPQLAPAVRGLPLLGGESALASYPAHARAIVPAAGAPAGAFDPALRSPRAGLPRWSGDGWVLLRPGSDARLAAGALVGRYGGSQAGAVVRYRLSAGDHRAALFARSSAALGSLAERELALGVAARPFPAAPVRAQLEARARQAGGSVRFAPAASLVSEIAPLALPFAFEAEPYLEAGYVGGRFATPFVGGQLRIERPVARLGAARVRLGAGAWGGAQEGAAALDLGPGATIELPLGEMRARLALDYRLRVAGDAEPGSGPTLTLATGF